LPVAVLLAVKDRSVTAVLLSFQGTPPGPPGLEGAPPRGARAVNAAVSGIHRAEAEVRASWLLLVGRRPWYRGALFG